MEELPNRAYFVQCLKNTPIYPYLVVSGLDTQFEPIYLTRKQRLRTEMPSIVILVDGLLKQYHRYAPEGDKPRFIQFILQGTTWPHDQERLSTTIKAVEPSCVLYQPLVRWALFLKQKAPFDMPNYTPFDSRYFCGLHLSRYLHTLTCTNDKLRFLKRLYGRHMRYLSYRQLALYAGISEAEARYYLETLRRLNP